MCEEMDVAAEPFLVALATTANIGSAATVIGNPQNILIGSFSGLGFVEFFLWSAPAVALGLLLNTLGLVFFFRHDILRDDSFAQGGEMATGNGDRRDPATSEMVSLSPMWSVQQAAQFQVSSSDSLTYVIGESVNSVTKLLPSGGHATEALSSDFFNPPESRDQETSDPSHCTIASGSTSGMVSDEEGSIPRVNSSVNIIESWDLGKDIIENQDELLHQPLSTLDAALNFSVSPSLEDQTGQTQSDSSYSQAQVDYSQAQVDSSSTYVPTVVPEAGAELTTEATVTKSSSAVGRNERLVTGGIIALLVGGFAASLSVAWAALAAVVLLTVNAALFRGAAFEPTSLLRHADLPLLVLIGSLFVVMAGARLTGAIELLYEVQHFCFVIKQRPVDKNRVFWQLSFAHGYS
jgi:hypothetical protein